MAEEWYAVILGLSGPFQNWEGLQLPKSMAEQKDGRSQRANVIKMGNGLEEGGLAVRIDLTQTLHLGQMLAIKRFADPR